MYFWTPDMQCLKPGLQPESDQVCDGAREGELGRVGPGEGQVSEARGPPEETGPEGPAFGIRTAAEASVHQVGREKSISPSQGASRVDQLCTCL